MYSKRHGACFVPHIALAQIFSRTARRSGFELAMTQGYSPRAKISFGPELPAGVVALCEPMDMFFAALNGDLVSRMNASLPDGFAISSVTFPDEGSPSIGKLCTHAEYLLRVRDLEALTSFASEFYGGAITRLCPQEDWLRLIITDPAQHPIGGLVKALIGDGILEGWHEINIVRVSIGKYDDLADKVGLYV